jgi:membrane-bound lytic murein transglycosylase B
MTPPSRTVAHKRPVWKRAMLMTTVMLTAGLTLAACAGGAALVEARNQASAPDSAGMSFPDWVRNYRGYALSNGISAATFDSAFANVRYNPRVTASNENQPEFGRAFWDYVDRAVSETRIANGREKLDQHRSLLNQTEQRYGVPPSIVTAIWGMESGYGGNLGSTNIVEALATLAYQGNRRKFGSEQLLAALKILEEKDIASSRMVGSWAGAMGHTQFIPTTYIDYAVDGDGDGRRNLWDSMPDVFGSTANYLAKKGWKRGQPCYVEVRAPRGFDYSQADLDTTEPASTWAARGVTRVDGKPLIGPGVSPDDKVAILIPTGHQGPEFAILENFRAVLRYNQAQTYALSVCLLANRIDGRGGIVADWPRNDPPVLATAERMEVQRLLAKFDASIGEPDGVFGRRTRATVRAYQAANGLVPDGYATQSLLRSLRAKYD